VLCAAHRQLWPKVAAELDRIRHWTTRHPLAELRPRSFPRGAKVELTVPEAVAGRKLLEWSSVERQEGGKATVTMDGERRITAVYEIPTAQEELFDWTGRWATLAYGEIAISQQGANVTGSFQDGQGQIRGLVGPGLLTMEWTTGGQVVEQHWWRLGRDKNSFTGGWRVKGRVGAKDTLYTGTRKAPSSAR
jgi:hypothetical protein